jgi:hypothetical protein
VRRPSTLCMITLVQIYMIHVHNTTDTTEQRDPYCNVTSCFLWIMSRHCWTEPQIGHRYITNYLLYIIAPLPQDICGPLTPQQSHVHHRRHLAYSTEHRVPVSCDPQQKTHYTFEWRAPKPLVPLPHHRTNTYVLMTQFYRAMKSRVSITTEKE